MKTLYIECAMGAAGDMLNAALYELLDEAQKREYVERMNSIGLDGVTVVPEKAEKCGIVGTHMRVRIEGLEEHEYIHEHEHHHEHEHEHHHEHEHEHEHHHEHEHEHEHHHSSMADITRMIDEAPVSEGVKRDAVAVYTLIAQAESHAHGRPVELIHFHEVGTKDAAADIIGCCLLFEMLSPERVVCSPIHVGSGHVHCAHGVLPVPAPATAYILRGAPIYGGGIPVELCTPTGAALLKHFVQSFGEMPAMRVSAVGYGMGRKDLPRANCVRAMLGETEDSPEAEKLYELACNLDDMTPERIAYAMERLFEGGALDVWTTPIGMKKTRPGVQLSVLCREEDREGLIKLVFRHTTTLGLRETECRRYSLKRTESTVSTEFGPVRMKEAEGFGVAKCKYEYEDLALIARERKLAIDEVAEMIDRGLIL